MMRHLFNCLLFACVSAVSAESEMRHAAPDPHLMQAWPAWLVGDHVKARHHFRAAAENGHPLGQYNLAMMLLNGEGGPCEPVEAKALLRKAADRGIDLARQGLVEIQIHWTSHGSAPLPCARHGKARRSSPALRPLQSSTR
jgi:TPR repeat protein